MDWAGGLREAERQELARQDQERRARERPDRDQPGGDRADQPFVDPEPTRMDWAADFREHDQRGGTATPERPSGERETAHTGQVAATRPTPIQAPAPTQPTPARPDKLLVGRPDSESPPEGRERPEGPAEPERPAEPRERSGEPDQSQEPEQAATAAEVQPPNGPSAKPDADRSGSNEAGDPEHPADQAADSQSSTDRPTQASATQEQETQVPATTSASPPGRPGRGHRRPGRLWITSRRRRRPLGSIRT